MKIRIEELTGRTLNWAVARARISTAFEFYAVSNWNPSGDWAQGGPIIEREMIDLSYYGDIPGWAAYIGRLVKKPGQGPTPLIAAMRCYVASQLGDEVDVPEELVK